MRSTFLWLVLAGSMIPAQEDPAVVSRLLAATESHPYISYSWGEHWQSLAFRFPERVHSFACLGPESFAGGEGGIFRSDDWGENWRPVETWTAGRATVLLTARFFALEPTVFAGTPEGLYRSRDAGGEWERVGGDRITGEVYDIAWPGPLLLVATATGLFGSEDGGDTWTREGEGLPEVALSSIEVSSFFGLDPVVFVGTAGQGLFRSGDGGARFERVGGPSLRTRTVHDLFWWHASLFAATDQGLYVSTDSGQRWTSASRVLEGMTVYAISIPAAETSSGSDILVGTDRGVYKSSDGGLSWRHLTEGMGQKRVDAFGSFPFPSESSSRPQRP